MEDALYRELARRTVSGPSVTWSLTELNVGVKPNTWTLADAIAGPLWNGNATPLLGGVTATNRVWLAPSHGNRGSGPEKPEL